MWWKIGGGLLLAGLLGFLVLMYGKARYNQGNTDGTSTERTLWQNKVVKAEQEKLAAYQAGVASVLTAENLFQQSYREKVVPITRTIVERSAAYAATPDGASMCLNSDRVLWLDETRRALFHPAAPAAPAVPAGLVPADAPGREP